MAEREGFLSRWSRLKRTEREQRAAVPELSEEDMSAAAPAAADPAEGAAPEHPAGIPDAELPPIESLDRYSDYSVFMRAGVSPELRKQALAKLWRSDPVLANLDGLLEYGEDYSLPFKTPGTVSTLYQIGRGMVEPEPEKEVATEPALPSSEPADTLPRQGDAADAKDEQDEPAATPAATETTRS